MTNREAIEYIERECHTCKGFYAPENECIAVPQDCFESKRLAISALEREEREKGCEYCNGIKMMHGDFSGTGPGNDDEHEYCVYTDETPDFNYCPMCGKRIGDK